MRCAVTAATSDGPGRGATTAISGPASVYDRVMATFRFRVPTQPPSVNHMYKIVTGYRKGGGTYKTLAKNPEVLQYQLVAANIAKHAAPKGWRPPKFVRIRYWFHLSDDADCDNILKALNDSFATAWKMNDRWFLPCVQEKTVGNRNPYVEVEVDDEQD